MCAWFCAGCLYTAMVWDHQAARLRNSLKVILVKRVVCDVVWYVCVYGCGCDVVCGIRACVV